MIEPYITTVSGVKFNFLDPLDEQIDIKDVAFSLANQCRFNGHVPYFSVAEHCVSVAARLPVRLQLAGLLHDASEAYLSDIPSPIKEFLPDYKNLERVIQNAVERKFGLNLTEEDRKEIHNADWDACQNEASYLLNPKGRDWIPVLFTPQEKFEPRCLPPPMAFKLFMTWFKDLTSPLESKLVMG